MRLGYNSISLPQMPTWRTHAKPSAMLPTTAAPLHWSPKHWQTGPSAAARPGPLDKSVFRQTTAPVVKQATRRPLSLFGASSLPIAPFSLVSTRLVPAPAPFYTRTEPERPATAKLNPAAPPPRSQRCWPTPWELYAGNTTATLPLHALHMVPRPHAVAFDQAIAAGASPFALADKYMAEHTTSVLSPSATSTWNVYATLRQRFGEQTLPLTAFGLIGFMLAYVRVKGNSSANLPSVMAQLSSFARTQNPKIPWPDFVAERGETMFASIARIQRDWPAEICPAPELTYDSGL
jgi:hypothetical protein